MILLERLNPQYTEDMSAREQQKLVKQRVMQHAMKEGEGVSP